MAPLNSSIPLMTFLFYCSSLLLVLFSYFPEKNLASFLTFDVKSLSPASYCSRTGYNRAGKLYSTTLELVHRFGPCSLDEHSKENKPSLADILSNDESRVDSIQARSKPELLYNDNRQLYIGNYVITVGLGTPQQNVTLIFDTSSSVTWTQCIPCAGQCYCQEGPVFNPRSSYSYSNISCNSSLCSKLGYDVYCFTGPCLYNVQYFDKSYSVGIVSKDRLTITPTADGVFPGFVFGCGQKNIGTSTSFGKTDGILGLGPDPQKGSFLYQTTKKYGQCFSYCLGSTSSSAGHLTFGRNGSNYPSEKLKFTPLTPSPYYYLIEIVGISVGGTRLPINQSVFTNAGTAVIDSDYMITRLPMAAYVTLRDAFKQKMGHSYPAAPAESVLDTCFDFGNHANITVPKVSFMFQGGANVDLSPSGIIISLSSKSVGCLAFKGNNDPNGYAVFGNTAQTTLEVVYDVAEQKIGFGPNGCK